MSNEYENPTRGKMPLKAHPKEKYTIWRSFL